MRIPVALVVANLFAGIAASCGSPQEAPLSPEAIRAAHEVTAGTVVRVRLNTALGTSESSPGQYFTATVVLPVANARGQTVLPAGALVTGRVIGVNQGAAARVQVLFTSVDAGQGPVPIAATVQQPATPNASYSVEKIGSEGMPYSAVLVPPRGAPADVPHGNSVGGGPTPTVNLPSGTALDLILTEPLVYPNDMK